MTKLFLDNRPSRQALGLLRSVRTCANRLGLGSKSYTDLVVPFLTDTYINNLDVYTDPEVMDDLAYELRTSGFPVKSIEKQHEDGSITLVIKDNWVLYENLNDASVKISSLDAKQESDKHDFTFKTILWRLDHLMERRPAMQNKTPFEIFLTKAPITDFAGRGVADLTKKLLSFGHNPEETCQERPLRMLEAVTWGIRREFLLTDDTYEAIRENSKSLLSVPGACVAEIMMSELAVGPKSDPEAPYVWLEELGLAPTIRKIMKKDRSAAKIRKQHINLLSKGDSTRLKRHGF